MSLSSSFKLDLEPNSISVSYDNSLALFTTRKGLFRLNLNKPEEGAVFAIPRHRKEYARLDSSIAQFCPHPSHNTICASINQRTAFVWDLEAADPLLARFEAHSRAITDIDFSPHDPNIFLSCSVDATVRSFDLREKRPTKTFSSCAIGASLVKWSKANPYYFASAHHTSAHIWDYRKASRQALSVITAHRTAISAMEWSPKDANELLTASSQDQHIKLWRIVQTRTPHGTIEPGPMLNKARYSPFGDAIVTTSSKHNENSIRVWKFMVSNTYNETITAYTAQSLVGHMNTIKGLEWGAVKDDSASLISCSADGNLRVWPISQQQNANYTPLETSERVGEEDDLEIDAISVQDEINSLKLFDARRVVFMGSGEVERQKLSLKGINPTMEASIELLLKNSAGNIHLRVSISIPPNYPKAIPIMRILDSPIRPEMETSLQLLFNKICREKLDRDMPCLRSAIGALVDELDKIDDYTIDENMFMHESQQQTIFDLDLTGQGDSSLSMPLGMSSNTANEAAPGKTFDTFGDACIPWPRTRGAVFFPNSATLVIFNSGNVLGEYSKHARSYGDYESYRMKSHLHGPGTAAGSLDDGEMDGFEIGWEKHMSVGEEGEGRHDDNNSSTNLSSSVNDQYDFSAALDDKAYYMWSQDDYADKEMFFEESPSPAMHQQRKDARARVTIRQLQSANVEPLEDLAQEYILESEDIFEACKFNALVAARHGRSEVVRTFQLAALIPGVMPGGSRDNSAIPFGLPLLMALVQGHLAQRDIQTVATLACLLFPILHSKKPSSHNHNHNHNNIDNNNNNLNSSYAAYHGHEDDDDDYTPRMVRSKSTPLSHSNGPPLPSTNQSVKHRVDSMDTKRGHMSFSSEIAELDDKPNLEDITRKCRCLYAELLFRWELHVERAVLLKASSTEPNSVFTHKLTYTARCSHCGQLESHAKCPRCNKFSMTCALCRRSFVGLFCFCLNCGHGGHWHHMKDWFDQERECPTGCGCECLEFNTS